MEAQTPVMSSNKQKVIKLSRIAACIALGMLLGACATDTMNDLVVYVDDVNSRPSGKIDPLPEIKIPEVFSYASSDDVDPFVAFVQEVPRDVISSVDGGVSPPNPDTHIKEELEYFPLDALRMVGTLARDDETWALITAPDGAVHRIQTGDYMGENYGKVSLVDMDYVDLMEIVPNGQGGWLERPAKLDLQSETE